MWLTPYNSQEKVKASKESDTAQLQHTLMSKILALE